MSCWKVAPELHNPNGIVRKWIIPRGQLKPSCPCLRGHSNLTVRETHVKRRKPFRFCHSVKSTVCAWKRIGVFVSQAVELPVVYAAAKRPILLANMAEDHVSCPRTRSRFDISSTQQLSTCLEIASSGAPKLLSRCHVSQNQ